MQSSDTQQPEGMGLYVHVPFCERKCDYCAFYSRSSPHPKEIRSYLCELKQRVEKSLSDIGTIRTVFIGGGTPTILTVQELRDLLGQVNSLLSPGKLTEFTCEANPASLDRERIDVLVAAGVDRLSVGVQSFIPRHRETIGRGGNLRGLSSTMDYAREAGVRSIGIDLIYGIPGQTLNDWIDDVRQACELGIDHLSTYALTLEEGTKLQKRAGDAIPDDVLVVGMWRAAGDVASRYGLERYEVSNLARPKHECRHNLEIWHGGRYLGLGPAASSFDGTRRWTQPADLAAWLEGKAPEIDELPADERAAEILAFGFRTTAGWEHEAFQGLTGFNCWELRGDELEALCEEGLLVCEEKDRTVPTWRGLLFADTIAERLL